MTFRSGDLDALRAAVDDPDVLHMSFAENNPATVRLLLDGGADPQLRTRIDSCETPLEMALSLGFTDIAAMLR